VTEIGSVTAVGTKRMTGAKVIFTGGRAVCTKVAGAEVMGVAVDGAEVMGVAVDGAKVMGVAVDGAEVIGSLLIGERVAVGELFCISLT